MNNQHAGRREAAMVIFVGGATASVGRMNSSALLVKGGQLVGGRTS